MIEGQNGLAAKSAVWITPGAIEMLGVSPLNGRSFLEGDGRPGTEDSVIISENVWRTEYAGDPQIIGRRVRLSGTAVTVVGVMPRSFHFPYWRTEIWRPYDLSAPPPAAAQGPVQAYARLNAAIPNCYRCGTARNRGRECQHGAGEGRPRDSARRRGWFPGRLLANGDDGAGRRGSAWCSWCCARTSPISFLRARRRGGGSLGLFGPWCVARTVSAPGVD